MKTFPRWIALASLGSLSLVGVAQSATELARVNGVVITLEEFNRKYSELVKLSPLRVPPKKAVLDDVIRRELAVQAARKAGLDKDPSVQDRLDTVLVDAFLQSRLSKELEKLSVSDEDAKKWYERNPEIRTSHIFVGVPSGASAEAQKAAEAKIKDIYENQVRPGKQGFSEVAQRFSEGFNAPMGGDVDYQTKDRLDPAYFEAAVALKTPGKISGVVRSQFGYHIIKLTGIKPWAEVDRGLVKRMVLEERRRGLIDRALAQLRSDAKISLRTELIKE